MMFQHLLIDKKMKQEDDSCFLLSMKDNAVVYE